MAKKDRYPELRRIIEANFDSIRDFSRQSKIGHAVVIKVMQGRTGFDRKKHRDRIASAIKTLLPGTDISGIWRRTRNVALAHRRRLIKEMFIEMEEDRHL